MSASVLAVTLKESIRAARTAGFRVVATVCDQASTNRSAINWLTQETEEQYRRLGLDNPNFGFRVDDDEVVPFYDPPHLLKGIRNNLMDRDLEFAWEGRAMRASWKHIVSFYEKDNVDPTRTMIPDLTDAHIYPRKMKKMKVEYAAQIFSHRLQSSKKNAIELANRYSLPDEAWGTAEFLRFMDKLFDSVNGNAERNAKKPLKGLLFDGSAHDAFWIEAIGVLRSVKFLRADRRDAPPSLTNWLAVIQGFRYF